MHIDLSLIHTVLRWAALSISVCFLPSHNAVAVMPSFDCQKVSVGSIEELVCTDAGLALLDNKLAEVYALAAQKAVNEYPPVLKAEQRGWVKARNECWKSTDRRECVVDSYRLRIAELQARYRLLPALETVRYMCDGSPANEVMATFFQTDPPSLIAERGDSVSMMYLQPSASGTKYRGRNETLWEHQGEARIIWGYGATEMLCQKTPMATYPPQPGSSDWIFEVERLVRTSDNAGHGPDIGSQEWMYTVGRKLGIYDSEGHGPDPGSIQWKEAVHRKVFQSEPGP
ncbi:MAG: MliC family protein [Deltaproteobacteria bacterium]|nr:MliC family protein [Deltaproteobacteria bacterium]MBW2519937.1 MliC family protein [Deltaproteobacteria bacterium]